MRTATQKITTALAVAAGTMATDLLSPPKFLPALPVDGIPCMPELGDDWLFAHFSVVEVEGV